MSNPQLEERIAQFRKMAQDDPDNELGHFRLGQLLMENGQVEDAARSFQRTLVLSPAFSKVYQLLAQCQLTLGRRDEAVRTLQEGYKTADQRGDKMPRDEMGRMLTELGEAVPAARPAAAPGAGTGFPCQRPGCIAGSYAHQLPAPPVPDAIGQRIHASICADCWNDWFRNYSIKVINELRLDLSTEHGQAEYDKYMRGFFGFEDEAGGGSEHA
jgi:tetratricopeptide (TPR) repeat protein